MFLKKLGEEIIGSKRDIFYLSVIYEKLTLLNKQLQDKRTNLFISKEITSAFLERFNLFRINIKHKELMYFHFAIIAEGVQGDDILMKIENLKNMAQVIEIMFKYLRAMNSMSWIVDPFEALS